MDVTAKEAFRLGFLARCAQEGLTGEHLSARIKSAAEKQSILGMALLGLGAAGAYGLASGGIAGVLNGAGTVAGLIPAGGLLGGAALARGGVRDLASGAGVLAGLIPAGGLMAGAGLGYGAAKMTEPNITDSDIKAQELADTYRIYAEKAKANRRARQYRVARQ